MNTLRELLQPRPEGQVYVDHTGNAVISAELVGLAARRAQDLIDRLAADLATASGVDEATIRTRYGITRSTP